jgi:lipoprotein-releasing system permease protein
VAGVVGGTLFITFLNPIAVVLAAMMGVELDMSQIYYFDHIPAVLVPMDVAVIAGTAVVLSFVSTLYPAWSAARLNPVDALRHE